jgi:hypothetical protein
MARDIPAGRAYVELFVKNSGLMRGLSQAKQRLESFAQTATLVGGSMMAAGVGMAAPIAMSLKTFASFEDAMAAVGAVSNESAPQLAELTDTTRS